MNPLKYRHIPIFLFLAALAGCAQKETPQQLQQQTAQATAEAKSDVKAVAEGIREGLKSDKLLDINIASREQLLNLPGVSGPEASKVIAARPYNETGELVSRHIMSKTEYDRIADRITAKR